MHVIKYKYAKNNKINYLFVITTKMYLLNIDYWYIASTVQMY